MIIIGRVIVHVPVYLDAIVQVIKHRVDSC